MADDESRPDVEEQEDAENEVQVSEANADLETASGETASEGHKKPADMSEANADLDNASGEERPASERSKKPDEANADLDTESDISANEESQGSEDERSESSAEADTSETAPDATTDAEDELGDVPEPDIPDDVSEAAAAASEAGRAVPDDVQKYARFKKMDGAQYDRVNEFLRDRTYITAREWAIARLCADFRTETGVEMTKIGNNLPELVPFMTDTYTPQAVNQARSSFENKIRQAGATFLYGAMSGFFTAEELDDMMYEVTEVAKFLLEVEGVDLSVDEELAAEDRISEVMREVQSASEGLRRDELECPNCGHEMEAADSDD